MSKKAEIHGVESFVRNLAHKTGQNTRNYRGCQQQQQTGI